MAAAGEMPRPTALPLAGAVEADGPGRRLRPDDAGRAVADRDRRSRPPVRSRPRRRCRGRETGPSTRPAGHRGGGRPRGLAVPQHVGRRSTAARRCPTTSTSTSRWPSRPRTAPPPSATTVAGPAAARSPPVPPRRRRRRPRAVTRPPTSRRRPSAPPVVDAAGPSSPSCSCCSWRSACPPARSSPTSPPRPTHDVPAVKGLDVDAAPGEARRLQVGDRGGADPQGRHRPGRGARGHPGRGHLAAGGRAGDAARVRRPDDGRTCPPTSRASRSPTPPRRSRTLGFEVSTTGGLQRGRRRGPGHRPGRGHEDAPAEGRDDVPRRVEGARAADDPRRACAGKTKEQAVAELNGLEARPRGRRASTARPSRRAS